VKKVVHWSNAHVRRVVHVKAGVVFHGPDPHVLSASSMKLAAHVSAETGGSFCAGLEQSEHGFALDGSDYVEWRRREGGPGARGGNPCRRR